MNKHSAFKNKNVSKNAGTNLTILFPFINSTSHKFGYLTYLLFNYLFIITIYYLTCCYSNKKMAKSYFSQFHNFMHLFYSPYLHCVTLTVHLKKKHDFRSSVLFATKWYDGHWLGVPAFRIPTQMVTANWL